MKRYLQLIALTLVLASCGASKNGFDTSQDKALAQAVKKYSKNPGKTELKAALVQLYNDATKLHLDKIEAYKSLDGANRWEKIIGEYEDLQKLHNLIYESDAVRQTITSKDYSAELILAKQEGAEAYYNQANEALSRGDRSSARSAYLDFKKAKKLVPGFRDTDSKIQFAYESSIINVVINPVIDNYYGYNSGYNYRNNYNQDNFQRNLVSDLGGSRNNNYLPARFFTDYEARRENINPDMEVDLAWVNLDIPRPISQQYVRNLSKQIQIGTDTSGRPYYQTVYGTLTITKAYFTARGEMEVRITDKASGRSNGYNRFGDTYTWEEEYATYRGDNRALSSNDYALINNTRYNNVPRREDVMDELYRRVYPQVKNKIWTAADW